MSRFLPFRHVNGTRAGTYSDIEVSDLSNVNTYVVEHQPDSSDLTSAGTYMVEQGLPDSRLETMEVVSGDTIPHDENTITIQVVSAENPVDLCLVCLLFTMRLLSCILRCR